MNADSSIIFSVFCGIFGNFGVLKLDYLVVPIIGCSSINIEFMVSSWGFSSRRRFPLCQSFTFCTPLKYNDFSFEKKLWLRELLLVRSKSYDDESHAKSALLRVLVLNLSVEIDDKLTSWDYWNSKTGWIGEYASY